MKPLRLIDGLTADSTGVQGIQIVDLKERLNQEIY